MPNQRRPGWGSAILVAGILLIAVVAAPRGKAALVSLGWNEAFSEFAVFLVGAAVIGGVMTAIAIAQGKPSLPTVKAAIFLFSTMVLICALQLLFRRLLDGLGLPRELSYYGAWISAILAAGWPAERLAKRLNIELPTPNTAA